MNVKQEMPREYPEKTQREIEDALAERLRACLEHWKNAHRTEELRRSLNSEQRSQISKI
jgi:hypothetical protein